MLLMKYNKIVIELDRSPIIEGVKAALNLLGD